MISNSLIVRGVDCTENTDLRSEGKYQRQMIRVNDWPCEIKVIIV